MLYKEICKILGKYLFGLSLALLIPFFLACYYQFIANPADHPQPHSTLAFFLTIIISLIAAYLFSHLGRHARQQLFRREGLAVVVVIWFITPLFAGLPFLLSGTLTNPFQAYFEASSGTSTTGATVMEGKQYDPVTGAEVPITMTLCGDGQSVFSHYGNIEPVRDPVTHEVLYTGIEAVSKALLFWRSLTQWLGGLGIIVLFVAILPALGVGGKILFQAEATGPLKESITPRITETAGQLWKIYFGLTFIQIMLLVVTNGNMSWLDAFTTTFGTISTGGLSIRNNSIAAYNNFYTEMIVMIFMILGSLNFSLYYFSLRGKFYRLYDPELWIYIVILLATGLFAVWSLVGTPFTPLSGPSEGVYSVADAFRYGFFQTISSQSTTGFATIDYDQWPYMLQALILILTFVGGMSGSTAGGIKIIRYYMLFRICQHKVESLFRPEAVHRFRVGGREVDQGAVTMVLCFFVIVISFLMVATFVLIVDGVEPGTAFTTMISMVTNGGMGFRLAGPHSSFAFLSNFGLFFSSFMMLLGRLEFFAVLVLLLPAFWKQAR